MSRPELCRCALALLALLAIFASPAAAVVTPETTPVREREMHHPDLYIFNAYRAPAELPAGLRAGYVLDLAALGIGTDAAYLDLRTGRWGTLMPARPLIPGDGVGNGLSWSALGGAPGGAPGAVEQAVWSAFVGYLQANRAQLGIDPAELVAPGRVRVVEGGTLAQIHAPRRVGGVTVRDSYLTAVVNHGNLVLFGANNWGDLRMSTEPSIPAEQAVSVVQAHLGSINVDSWRQRPHLVLVPMSRGADLSQVEVGSGLTYRLAWVVSPDFDGDFAAWEGLVDAHSGELLAFEDRAHYVVNNRSVVGGVYPVSNDGIGPEGTEQAGWPMPFADLDDGLVLRATDSGGNLNLCVDGTVTTHLAGPFVRISDQCGAIDESTAGPLLDLGTSGGDDCTVPPGHSPGDTHAARSGFYEINRIKQQASAYLPGNAWLEDQLTAVMNINQVCNANWNGSTVNFYRSGSGCRNTGEIAGIFDHEWGHGMDNNDLNPSISSPGEGIADIYASLRLNTSCIGRGFFEVGVCGGYGDPCTPASGCSGVRDIDFANRTSGLPHDVSDADTRCGSGSSQPCGGSTHCEGAVYAESVWDLWNRDLTAAPYSLDLDTAREIATRLTYLGAGLVGQWFQCTPPFGGCGANGGYLNYLAADDDNGLLSDGTPHMAAIFAAYDRHEAACATPTVTDSGCAGGPTTAPVVTANPLDRGASLSWPAVPGATKYAVYRGEGVFACSIGKEKVAEVTGTSYVDSGLTNGFDAVYQVAAIGPADTCIGPMSSCSTVTPVAGANLAIDVAQAGLAIRTGDLDPFLDNCEVASLTLPIHNIGTGAQTNVRVVDVTSPSNPGMVVATPLPAAVSASMAACDVVVAEIDVIGGGLAFNDQVTFDVEITSDELAGVTKTHSVTFGPAESSFTHFGNKTYTYEADIENWQVVTGTFNRTNVGGGGNGTAFYLASSSFLDGQCDQVRSPILKLGANSTLSLYNSFDIEPFFGMGGVWYDRANVGVVDVETGVRTAVSPSGGRLYNASGPNGNCGTEGQPGWADQMTPWVQSTFSAAALGSASIAGDLVQLAVHYGTDPAANGFGFHFDEVRLTNFDEQGADAQSNVCTTTSVIFTDGFESGDTSAWSLTVP